MKIIKFPKMSYTNIHIRAKCSCGCKVVLEDMSDIIYLKGLNYQTPVIDYGWICPWCHTERKLSEYICHKISKKLSKQGVNLHNYVVLCDSIQFNFPLPSPPTDARENPISSMQALQQMGVPLPKT